jgi:hypothetical protein
MSRPSNIIVATIKRNQRFRGPTSSEQQNDFQAEVVRDLTSIQQEWNNKIVPLTSKLPDGTDDSTVNAFTNGLDGQTLYVNANATITLSGGRYYNNNKDRPNTVFEQFVNVFTYIDDQIATLEASISTSSSSGGLTAAQKTRIGDNIFNNAVASTSNSLDGKTQIHSGNILQLARDMYGVGSPTLNSNGDTVLTNSLRAMVDALLELHGGNWDNDISVNHSAISASDITTGTLSQSLVGPSSASPGGVNDSFVGAPTNTVEDFNQLRRLLKEIKGTGAFSSTITPDGTWGAVTPSPDSFVDLISLKGTGTRSNNNPWGYSYVDILDLVTVLEAIRDFTGQDTVGDSTPTYDYLYGFQQGDSLVDSISAVASGLSGIFTVSGNIEAHLLDSGNPHNVNLTQVSLEGGFAQASQITITDVGGYYTSATVEEALQEIALGLSDGEITGSGIAGHLSLFEDTNTISSTSGLTYNNSTQTLTANRFVATGAISFEPTITNSGLTLDNTHSFVYVDSTASGLLIGLPESSSVNGRLYVIKKIDTSLNPVIVSGIFGDLIDLQYSWTLDALDSITIQATNSGYFVI